MATQIYGNAATGKSVYARRHRTSTSGTFQILNTVSGSWGVYSTDPNTNQDYAIDATEEGSTGVYLATTDIQLVDDTIETHLFYEKVGAEPVHTDPLVDSYETVYDETGNLFTSRYTLGSIQEKLTGLGVNLISLQGSLIQYRDELFAKSSALSDMAFPATIPAQWSDDGVVYTCASPSTYSLMRSTKTVDMRRDWYAEIWALNNGDRGFGFGLFRVVADENDVSGDVVDNTDISSVTKLAFQAGVIVNGTGGPGTKGVNPAGVAQVILTDVTGAGVTNGGILRLTYDPINEFLTITNQLSTGISREVHNIFMGDALFDRTQPVAVGVVAYDSNTFLDQRRLRVEGAGFAGDYTVGSALEAADMDATLVTPGVFSVPALANAPTGSGGGGDVPVSQIPVPKSRTWLVTRTSDGLIGERPIGMSVGEIAHLAIDFHKDLAINGRLADFVSIEIKEGTGGGVTFDQINMGIDKTIAKVKTTAVTSGVYVITATVTYADASGGATIEADTILQIND